VTLRECTLLLALAAPLAAGAEEPQKLTIDTSGWLILNGYSNQGALNASDLPRFALPKLNGLAVDDERVAGVAVRQSRLRMNVGIPSDGLLAIAKLKGFVEADFAGGYVNNDTSVPLPRLRHLYVSATWNELGKLTVLAGQTWAILHSATFPEGFSHLAVPRFGGAGLLFRRAPQLRVQGELGGDAALLWQVGALAPGDKQTTTDVGAGVGERSGLPDGEARLAFLYRAKESPVKAEVGLAGHYGQEKWMLEGGKNETLTSKALAADCNVSVPYVTVRGGAFIGQNLDVSNSVAAGVRTTQGTTPGTIGRAESVRTKGVWTQAAVTPFAGLAVLLGGGVEAPRKGDLPLLQMKVGTNEYSSIYRNAQLSGGVVYNLTSKWKVSAEYTRYVSYAIDGSIARAGQVEVASLLAL
jgi:hypothetical protein